MRSVAEKLRLDYAQFLELEFFTRIEGGGDDSTRRALDRGRRVRAALVQPALAPLSQGEQVAVLMALEAGTFDEAPVNAVAAVRERLQGELDARYPGLLRHLDAGDAPGVLERQQLLDAVGSLISQARHGQQ